jgi:hypothetical protein
MRPPAQETGEPYLPGERHRPTAAEPLESPEVLDLEAALLVSVGDAAPHAARSAFSLCPDKVDPAEPVPAARFAANGWDEWRLFREDTIEVSPPRGGPVPHPRRVVESCRNTLAARGRPRPSPRRAAHALSLSAPRCARAELLRDPRRGVGVRGGPGGSGAARRGRVRGRDAALGGANKHTPLPIPRAHAARPAHRRALLAFGRCTRTSTTCP